MIFQKQSKHKTKQEWTKITGNWYFVKTPKLKKVKLRCEKLAVWLEMKEYNDTGYETKCQEFEMLQLVEKYLQDDVGDYNKIISNEAKKSKLQEETGDSQD